MYWYYNLPNSQLLGMLETLVQTGLEVVGAELDYTPTQVIYL